MFQDIVAHGLFLSSSPRVTSIKGMKMEAFTIRADKKRKGYSQANVLAAGWAFSFNNDLTVTMHQADRQSSKLAGVAAFF